MNKLSNRKKLAEIKDSLDALEEKYLDRQEATQESSQEKYNQTSTHLGSFAQTLNEYIGKLNSKRKDKRMSKFSK